MVRGVIGTRPCEVRLLPYGPVELDAVAEFGDHSTLACFVSVCSSFGLVCHSHRSQVLHQEQKRNRNGNLDNQNSARLLLCHCTIGSPPYHQTHTHAHTTLQKGKGKKKPFNSVYYTSRQRTRTWAAPTRRFWSPSGADANVPASNDAKPTSYRWIAWKLLDAVGQKG